jgi:hypothetical protein
MVSRLAVLALAASLVGGCGRSSMFGSSPFDCPPAMLQPDGTCGAVDLGHFDLRGDLRDGGPMCGPESQCAFSCISGSECCQCSFCAKAPGCRDMGGIDGGPPDLVGDLCGDKSNCMLPECAGDPRCHVLGTEVCNNCVDDNDNGLIDCADPQCANFPGCEPGHMCPTPPVCTDPTCACGPACKDLKCHPTVDFGTINPMGSSVTRMENTQGSSDVAATQCAPGGAGMVVGQFTLSGLADVTLSFTQANGEDHVFGLFQAGINQACGDNPVNCYDPKGATTGTHTYASLPAGDYFLITQAFEPAGQGPVTVTLATESMKACCHCGVPGPGGLVDCQNADCVNDPGCINQECKPDLNVGALVVDAPGAMVSFDTTTADVENNLTCEAAKGGKDVVVRFSLKETAGLLLQFDQSGDHVIGLFRFPEPGAPCDFYQLSCYDPSARPQDEVSFGDLPPGDYELIFKATKPGTEGHIDATISAYRDRMQPLCNTPDACASLQCVGVNGCTGPYCMPNVQLGTMQVGQSRTVKLDVATDGIVGYKASCARGGGKGMVVQLSIPSAGPMGGVGIGFDCTETGDQIIDLDAQTAPRALCDADELVCADPKILPFGCGYEVPNLQAGTYNVIVEGFQAGSEGTMNLTLSVVDDRQLVDCRQPGACLMRQCVTSQYCANAQCRPSATIDPMPLDGSTVFELVQTASNGVHGTVPCATAPGGQTAALLVRLTTAADLKVSWQQIGNHAVALYTDDGAALPCDAGTLLGCAPAIGAGKPGMVSFTNVPPGRYYLLVAGNQPDTSTTQYSGSIDLALSGTPHL